MTSQDPAELAANDWLAPSISRHDVHAELKLAAELQLAWCQGLSVLRVPRFFQPSPPALENLGSGYKTLSGVDRRGPAPQWLADNDFIKAQHEPVPGSNPAVYVMHLTARGRQLLEELDRADASGRE